MSDPNSSQGNKQGTDRATEQTVTQTGDRATAVSYLSPPGGAVWEWCDDGRSLAWKSGETIAFWQEILTVVNRLAPQGLPPFSAIVLLLAATRDGWSAASVHLQEHARELVSPGGGDPTSAKGVTLRAIGHRLESDTARLITGLNRVAGLPGELRRPLAAKRALAELVFADAAPFITAENAGLVVAELSSAADMATYDLGRTKTPPLRNLVDTIDALQKGVDAINAERVRLLLKTGIDSEIQLPEEDLGPSQRVTKLLAEIAEDPELGGLSRLARRLLPAVHVPRSLLRQQDMPIGGVADITNRGQLDRLLLTELAADDLTLAVRVALNEALYLQRESPPREPPHHRRLLIDTGIRTWGVPRVYATAVALALVAGADDQGDVSVFRPDGIQLVPTDLTTRPGIVAHMESLGTRPHFAAALPAFFADSSSDDGDCESFLITHEEVLEDPEFRSALMKQEHRSTYAATVSRDGTFRLWAVTGSGKSLVRQASLDLDALLAPPKKKSLALPMIDRTDAGDLPVILGVQPFPLLLPPGYSPRRVIRTRDAVAIAVTRDKRLLQWSSRQQGARMISDRVPPGRLDVFRLTDDESTVMMLFTQHSAGATKFVLWAVDLEKGPREPLTLLGIDERAVSFAARDDVVFVIGRDQVYAYGLNSALPLATVKRGEFSWSRGRIFHGGQQGWAMLALNGSRPVFEPIPNQFFRTGAVFELRGWPGPLFMDSDGTIHAVSPQRELVRAAPERQCFFEGVSSDGDSIIASASAKPSQRYVLNLHSQSWQPTSWLPHVLMHSHSQQPIVLEHDPQLRTRFSGVLAHHGALLLRTMEGNLLAIQQVGTALRMVPPGFSLQMPDAALHGFRRVKAPAGVGYSLRAAEYGGRDQVLLDSRGLLHLKSATPGIPEITLTLPNNGPMAGWTSDRKFYGDDFYFQAEAQSVSDLQNLIARFVGQLN